MPSIHDLVKKKLALKLTHHKKSKPKTESKPKHKGNKTKRSHKQSMAKGKGKGKSKGSHGGLGNVKGQLRGITDKIKPYATSLGMGTIAVLLLSKLKPDATMQHAQFAGLAGEYLGGDITTVIGAEIIKSFAGVPSILQGLGGGGQQAMPSGASYGGSVML